MRRDRTRLLTHPISRTLHEERTRGERWADRLERRIGSWRFLALQSVGLTVWVGANVTAVVFHWDPYPFVLLHLCISLQAAYIGPVLLLAANRAAQRDRTMAEHDHATNEKSEQLVEAIMSELLRNSQATLAIAERLAVRHDAVTAHGKNLNEKFEPMQAKLAEVEDVMVDIEPTARRPVQPA